MADNTTRLDLPYLAPAQAQKHVTVNETLRRLDSLVMLCLESRQISAQPSLPAEGSAYLLPMTASGSAWSQFSAGSIAVFEDNAWRAFAPKAGFTAFIRDEAQLMVFDATQWRPIQGAAIRDLQDLNLLGIGTQADANNPIAAKINKALWTARYAQENGSGDLRFTFNKENTSRVLSLLFQSNYAARAEIGLIGNDELVFRASSDGVNFVDIAQLRTAQRALQTPNLLTGSINNGPLSGFRNRLVNGAFLIHQRQAAGGTLAAGVYIADRWRTSASGATVTVAGGVVTLTSGAIVQSIEPENFGLAGQSVVVSVGGTSANSITVSVSAYGTGSGSVSGTIAAGSGRRGVALAVPSTVTGGALLQLSTAGSAVSFSEVMLTQGTQTESFFEVRPFGMEVTLCERYYEKSYDLATAPSVITVNGAPRNAFPIPQFLGPAIGFKTRKRGVPSITVYSPATGVVNRVTADGVDYPVTLTSVGESGFSAFNPNAAAQALMTLHYTANAEY